MPFPRLRVRPRRSGLGRPTSQCRRRDHPGFRTLPRPFDSDSTRTERFDFILLESVNWEAADHHVRRTSSGECPPRTSTTRVSATSARCGFEPVCLCLRCDATYSELDILVVDSNSTRTESYVAIRPDPEAPSMVDVPKAADHNGYQQIMGPGLALRAGLKILVSAVQSRPSPPFVSRYSEDLHASEFQQSAIGALDLARTCLVPRRRAVRQAESRIPRLSRSLPCLSPFAVDVVE